MQNVRVNKFQMVYETKVVLFLNTINITDMIIIIIIIIIIIKCSIMGLMVAFSLLAMDLGYIPSPDYFISEKDVEFKPCKVL